ncbi:MAG: hypothetical protein OEZ04_11235 [Nitrospinota bacterium]|nr:hypothetical protein [Nitrospinota bacterium]
MHETESGFSITRENMIGLLKLRLDDRLKRFSDRVADAVIKKHGFLPNNGTLIVSFLFMLYFNMELFGRQMQRVGRPDTAVTFEDSMLANLAAVAATVEEGDIPFYMFMILHEPYLANAKKFFVAALDSTPGEESINIHGDYNE